MKKIFTLFIMMFALLGFVACNNGSDLDISYDEQIAFPTNLSIDGNTLRWDEIDDASGYYVYVDGEEVDSVRTNSFDFSKLDGSRLIFTVVTKAPRGMQDSTHSVSIAYVENKAVEVQAMKLAVEESGMPFSEAFAEELVDKGMLATEFEDMMEAMEEFMEAMEDVQDVESAYAALDIMMANIENPEAMISALVKYVLPDQIDEQIEFLEDEIEDYQWYIDNDFSYGGSYHQDKIDELNNQILALEELKIMIANSADDVVKSVLFVAEYVMQIEEMMTQDLIENINNLTQTESAAELSVPEMVLIKEEMVNILYETMPNSTDIILVINTIYSFSDVLAEIEDINLGTLVYPEKMAATMLMSFEAYIRFLDNLDEAFFTELKAIGEADYSEYRLQAEMAILGITYFDDFLADNEDLFDEIEDVYTEEEKELMFNQYMESLEDALELQSGMNFAMMNLGNLTFMTFEKMMTLRVIFEDAFNDFLDAFVESEGEILILAAEAAEYEDDFYDQPYELRDYVEFDFNNNINQFKIADQVIYLANSVISERSQDEFEEVRGFLVDYLSIYFPMMFMFDMENGVNNNLVDIMDSIEIFIDNTSDEQYELIQSIFKYLDEENILLEYANQYETAFEDDLEMLYQAVEYFNVIFLLDFYDDYMTRSIRDNLDNIIEELALMLENEEFAGMEMNAQVFTDLLDYFDEVAPEVKDFDYNSLTSVQTARLNEIMEEIEFLAETVE